MKKNAAQIAVKHILDNCSQFAGLWIQDPHIIKIKNYVISAQKDLFMLHNTNNCNFLDNLIRKNQFSMKKENYKIKNENESV